MTARSHPPRGFTLIELMVVVCIIGLLSTVAMPVYKKATLRARAAERATILQSLRTGIEDAYARSNIRAGGLHGAPNPAGLPGTGKRSFANSAGDWGLVNIVVQGDCYYTYEFHAAEATASVTAQYDVSAVGDLDGDSVQSTKQFVVERSDGRWNLVSELPAPGEEDALTF